MSKRKGNNTYSKGNNDSIMPVIIIALVVIIGAVGIFALTSNSGGGTTAVNSGVGSTGAVSAGGESVSSLESQVETLTEQVKNNPNDPALHENLGTALFNLANTYEQSNDPKTAETFNKTIQVYNETLKLNPNSKETLGDLATAYFYINQTDMAIATVQKALEIDPTFAPALLNYSIYLSSGKGDYAGAIKQLEKVPSGTPQYDQAQSFIKDFKQAMASK